MSSHDQQEMTLVGVDHQNIEIELQLVVLFQEHMISRLKASSNSYGTHCYLFCVGRELSLSKSPLLTSVFVSGHCNREAESWLSLL